MKHLYITNFIIMMSVCFITSCTQDEWTDASDIEAIIIGNSIERISSPNNRQPSRSIPSYLPDGTQISFYSSEGLQSDGQILTLSQGYWKGELPLIWNKPGLTAKVCAYHPPLPQNKDAFYQANGQLIDLLVAQQSYQFHSPISLHFEHLFAQVNFQVEEALNQQIKQITFTPKQGIKEIDPYKALLTTDTINATQSSVTFDAQTNGMYSILVVPGEKQNIAIKVVTKDNHILHKQLEGQEFLRNQSYLCHIKQKVPIVGIDTTDDFIAFTYLINGFSYKGRTLDEFKVTKNGVTTYYLNNDLQFTNEEAQMIREIGIKGFKDVFDGQGHTLHNLRIKEEKTSNLGLFANITEKGMVQNLTIDGCITKFAKAGGATGILCGHNKGKIINCHVLNSEIIAMQKEAGGIVGNNQGSIINCSVRNFRISLNPKQKQILQFGGITNMNYGQGMILNCLVTNLQMGSGKINPEYLACAAYINYGAISNFVSNYSNKHFHPFCKDCNKPCDHCYYPGELNYPLQKTKGMKVEEMSSYSVLSYLNHPESLTTTASLLNQWIDEQGKQIYPSYDFKRWKVIDGKALSF